MSFIRLLENKALYQCCMSQINKLWHHRLPFNPIHIEHFSSVHLSLIPQPPSRIRVGSVGSTLIRTKHDARFQAAVQQTSTSSAAEMLQTNAVVTRTNDVDIANFLREISVICKTVEDRGLTPTTQWQDPSSVDMVDRLHGIVASLTPLGLLHVIIALPSLPDIDDFVKQVTVSQFRKSMRHLSVAQLVHFVQSSSTKDLGLHPSVYDDAMYLVQQRWVEIKSCRDVVSLLYIVSDDNTQFLDRLEDRALDLCDSMNVKELYRTVYCLARRRRRNTPLLRALMYYLDRQELYLSPVHLSNLAFALGVLNVHDPGVMEKLINAVCKVVHDRMHPANVVRHMLSSVVQSLGILRWFDKNFMDVAVDRFTRLNVDPSDWARLLHTLASVNYVPPQLGKSGLVAIVEQIASLSQDSPMLWLDAVWSCCVLDSLSAELAASVLSPEFIVKLQSEDYYSC